MRRRFRRIFRGLSRRRCIGGFRLDLLARCVGNSWIGEVVFELTDSYRDGISCSVFGMPS